MCLSMCIRVCVWWNVCVRMCTHVPAVCLEQDVCVCAHVPMRVWSRVHVCTCACVSLEQDECVCVCTRVCPCVEPGCMVHACVPCARVWSRMYMVHVWHTCAHHVWSRVRVPCACQCPLEQDECLHGCAWCAHVCVGRMCVHVCVHTCASVWSRMCVYTCVMRVWSRSRCAHIVPCVPLEQDGVCMGVLRVPVCVLGRAVRAERRWKKSQKAVAFPSGLDFSQGSRADYGHEVSGKAGRSQMRQSGRRVRGRPRDLSRMYELHV